MLKELDTVVLARDLKDFHLKRGDVGAVVYVYEGGTAFEIEFVTGEGKTIAVVTLPIGDVRPMRHADILHVRAYATA